MKNPDRNIERLEHIAKWLDDGAIHTVTAPRGEKVKFTFLMDYWRTEMEGVEIQEHAGPNAKWIPGDCGGAMCIGGAAEVFFGNGESISNPYLDTDHPAAEILGLDLLEAKKLFYPWEYFVMKDILLTPERAANVLRHLIETGDVDWSVVAGVEKKA